MERKKVLCNFVCLIFGHLWWVITGNWQLDRYLWDSQENLPYVTLSQHLIQFWNVFRYRLLKILNKMLRYTFKLTPAFLQQVWLIHLISGQRDIPTHVHGFFTHLLTVQLGSKKAERWGVKCSAGEEMKQPHQECQSGSLRKDMCHWLCLTHLKKMPWTPQSALLLCYFNKITHMKDTQPFQTTDAGYVTWWTISRLRVSRHQIHPASSFDCTIKGTITAKNFYMENIFTGCLLHNHHVTFLPTFFPLKVKLSSLLKLCLITTVSTTTPWESQRLFIKYWTLLK